MRTALRWLLLAIPLAAQIPPGQLIDAGGYRVHLYCVGKGSPTVVLIGGFSIDWSLVQAEIARRNRVCSYDASGNAWSERGPAVTCNGRVEEIRRMLANAQILPPYLLAGLSVGALYARLYVKTRPDEVSAIVFVDHAFIPPIAIAPPAVDGPDSPPVLLEATPIRFGIGEEPGLEHVRDDIKALQRWAMSRDPDLPTAELAQECCDAIGDADLNNIPLVIVSTANATRGYAELQSELLALSGHSKQMLAERSFHSIELSQPEIVIEAIRTALETAAQ